jgi:hypothetical protein
VSLVTVAEQLGFMREPEGGTEEDELQNLLDQLEALLISEANRADVPFKTSAETGRVEYQDGTGKLGTDPSNPLETLSVSDKTILRYAVGERRIVRVDGGKFGSVDQPMYVEVTYDTQPDRTEDLDAARLGIMRRAAAIHRQRGIEGYVSTALSEVRYQFDKDLDAIPEWKAAVAICRRMSVI